MAYKIEYARESMHRYPLKSADKKWKPLKLFFLGFLIAAAFWMRLNGIPDFLIPGDAVVTRAATSHFIEHVQTGMPIGEAVTVFCQQIIAGEGL